jgi:hypothetical protein
VVCPGFRDLRGYQAMYRDFYGAIREGGQPEMSLERAIEDQVLMDRVYLTVDRGGVTTTGAGRDLPASGS